MTESLLSAHVPDDEPAPVFGEAPQPARRAGSLAFLDAEHLPSIFDVLENTTDSVALLDHRWRFTYLNRHAAASLGPGKDLIGTHLKDLFRPERGTEAWEKMVVAARKRQSVSFEFYASRLAVWFEVHIHPIPSGLQIFFRDITARRAANDARTEGEARLRLALEAAGDGAWDWDIVSGEASMSVRLVRNLGYGSDPFVGPGSNFAQIIHRDDAEGARRALLEHLRGHTDSYRCEYRVRTRERTWRWVLVRGRVIARDEATGRATRMVGISSDITERKAAEEKAVEQANLLSLAQTGAKAGAWSYDPATRNVQLSPLAVELLGLPPEHDGIVALDDWPGIIEPADQPRMRSTFKNVLATRTSFAVDYRVRLPGGGTRWIHSVASHVEDASGKTDRLIGLILDVTDRRTAADALRQSEERLQLALDAAGDGVWEYDLVTDTTVPSQRLLTKLGYAPDAIGLTLASYTALVHPEDIRGSVKAFQEHLRGHTEAYSTEYRIRTASGEWLWFLDRGRAVERDPATGRATRMVGTHSDITEKKRAEIELQRVQGELVHLSRLSAMGAMASTLAHELNQPLTSIVNFAGGLRRVVGAQGQADALLSEALTGIEGSALRAGEIVRRLRNYVTKGDVEQRSEQVGAIVKAACTLALVDAPRLGIDCRIEISDGLPPILVDAVQIQQVLLNLIRNAIEAMDGRADRRLAVSIRPGRRRAIEFRVSDSGAGIEEAMRDQLFTPFASSKADGMGVGLSICRTIIEAHRGRIWAEDNATGGASFCFTLPSYRELPTAPRAEP